MELPAVLQEIGLSQGESDVYLALLKLGEAPVSKIKEETRHHRTVIYDFIEHLITKNLASYVIRKNVRYYRAAEPSKLIEYLKEKQQLVDQALPSLESLSNYHKDEVVVQVFRGKGGLQSALNDVLSVADDEMLGLGVDEEFFENVLGRTWMEQFFRKEKELDLKERLLTFEEAPLTYDTHTTTYRVIPKEYFDPTAIFIYGNKVGIIIWEPLTVIQIECASLANSYRKNFEMLWTIAKPLNKAKQKKEKRV